MTNEEKDFIQELAEWFYGTKPDQVTAEMGEVLSEMLAAVVEKSEALNYVPRPTATRPGLAWLVSEGVMIGFRSQKVQAYDIAVKTVALQYRSLYEMAKLGI